MKILIVHRSLYLDGGDTRYTIELTKLLTEKGHEVVIFNYGDHRNEDLGIRTISSHEPGGKAALSKFDGLGVVQKMRYGISSAFSLQTYKKMRSLLRQERFDIVHIQSIHHTLTTSILLAMKEANVPVVWTLHDYRLICPESHLFRDGEICELCVTGSLMNAITHKCKRDSFLLSSGAVLASLADHITRCYEIPKKFIAPSNDLLRRFVSAGFEESRFEVVYHFVHASVNRITSGEEKGILYFGRFSREKGIEVLLRTSTLLRHRAFQLVGDGEMRGEIEEFCASSGSRNVTIYPFMDDRHLLEMISRAELIVCPSQWAEVFGLTILESMALGKIVIASAVGAIPEIIEHGVNGLLVQKFREAEEWARSIEAILGNPMLGRQIRTNAIETARIGFSRDAHYAKLVGIYESVLVAN